jgi:hypothetical protein
MPGGEQQDGGSDNNDKPVGHGDLPKKGGSGAEASLRR